MQNPLIEKLEALSLNNKSLSMQQVEEFVHETIKFFDRLRTTMTNGTPEEKEKALKESHKLQEHLQAFSSKIFEQTGMSEKDIQKFLAKGNFAAPDMRHFQAAQQEINDYREKIASDKKLHHGHKI
jgi:hypothetical protein